MTVVRLADGASVQVEERAGDGVPVVLLHGVLEDARAWDRVASRLHAAGRRVLIVESRGHGASEPWTPGMAWGPEEEAEDVTRVLEALAPDGAHLVGASRGATAASWIAVERPELVRSLTVVCSPPHASEPFRAYFRQRIPRAQDAREEACLRYLAGIPEDSFPQNALRRFEGPTLVVEAGDDPLYSPTHTMFWRMFLPYATFDRREGGHRFHQTEEGAEWLAERLLKLTT